MFVLEVKNSNFPLKILEGKWACTHQRISYLMKRKKIFHYFVILEIYNILVILPPACVWADKIHNCAMFL